MGGAFVIPALRSVKQEDHEFQGSLGYIVKKEKRERGEREGRKERRKERREEGRERGGKEKRKEKK
jgi:hypothetical protein